MLFVSVRTCIRRLYLKAGSFRLVHIKGLKVAAPVINQFVVIVVVLLGHLGRLVMMRLVHVNHLHAADVNHCALADFEQV